MRLTLAAVLVLLAAAPTALAQPSGGPRAACAPDIAQFCPQARPGDGSIRQCVAAHRDQLSAACKAAIAARIARREAGGAPPGH